jgi:heavy metal sensor kinase
MKLLKQLSIRWKLTLWYGAVLATVLLAFSATVYAMVRHQLLRRLDQGLEEELSDVLREVGRHSDTPTLLKMIHHRFAEHAGFDFEITDQAGDALFRNRRLVELSMGFGVEPALSDTPQFADVEPGPSGRWRVVAVLADSAAGPLTVKVGRPLEDFEYDLSALLLAFLLMGPLTLLLAMAGGYFLACRVLRPIHRISQTARQITADGLHERISTSKADDELGALAQTLNGMIERLERSFSEMQRFTADAAHELRTPLAVIRAEAEVALRSTRSADEYRQVLENVLEEANGLAKVADQLLFLCRHRSGVQRVNREPVALDELLLDVTTNMQLVAQEKGVTLTLAENEPCTIVGDTRHLRRAFYNLLDNAIKYTRPGGRVIVTSHSNGDLGSVKVADTGIGISPEHVPHVFERFYRADASRSDDDRGAGLGLSICQSIVQDAGGSVTVESVMGAGSTFTVTFPLRRGSA